MPPDHHIEHVGTDDHAGRKLYVVELTSAEELPASLDPIEGDFTALLIWDARSIDTEIISRLAGRLMELGGVYFCAWGPDCERVHDVIDEEWLSRCNFEPPSDQTLMTTWHDDESLAEAIWFAIHVALPMDAYFDKCRSVVGICIDCPEWAAEVRAAFADPSRLEPKRSE